MGCPHETIEVVPVYTEDRSAVRAYYAFCDDCGRSTKDHDTADAAAAALTATADMSAWEESGS